VPDIMSCLPETLEKAFGAYDSGDFSEAERLCTRILAVNSEFLDALHLLALTQSELGKNNAALDNYNRALAIRPEFAEALNNRGNILQNLGRFDEAVKSYEQALAIRPDYAEAHNNRGNALHDLKRLDEALKSYEKALEIKPDYADTLNNRGVIFQELARFDEALESYEQALAIRPDYAEALNNRGNTLQELKRFDEALESYEQALAIRPDYPEAHNNRGVTFQDLARLDEALESFERALAIKPDYAEALNNRGNTLQELARFDEALESYERALEIRPGYADAHNNRGNTLQELKRFDEALESYEQALAIRPDYAEALNNRGNTLQKLGRFDEALEGYERAVAIRADYAEAFNNRGNALQELVRFDEALESYQRALAIRPDYAACHVNRAFLLLQTGRFAEGWQGYEWRRKIDSGTARLLSGPEWTGGDTNAKRLLFYSEQGLGDTIQFSRFACSIAASGKEVLLEVQPSLGGLLDGLGGVKVIRNGATVPEHDAELPLMSLPHVLGTTPETMPGNLPYLFAEPARVEAWAKRLPSGQFRVGIVWQGKSTGDVDIGRSIPLRSFAPLCRIPGLTLISLQKYDGAEQLAHLPPGMTVETLGAEFDAGSDAFVDCAAVMMNLDLVISSDTAAAHLAGALGRPVWIVLKHVPDWRWMMDREDTPWYPTARLFRQARRDDWDEVFERIAAELARAAAAKIKPGDPLPQGRTGNLDPTQAVPPGTALVPVSFGELVDKITILEIKSERIDDAGKLINVRAELELLATALARFSVLPPRAGELKAELRGINEALWEIEDQIRDCERNNDFGAKFVGLARSVYMTNDRRSAVKRQLNQLAGSVIVEEKSYTEDR
jgi:tetratricopeptide (TPR) repeat protein